MDWNIIESRWNEYKAAAKRQWNKLSEGQLSGTRGKREYLVRRVQDAYALSSSDAEQQVTDWQAKQVDRLARAANGA